MQFSVRPDDPLPLYAQIADQLRGAIARGAICPEEQLPTVRQLAVDLRINPNTVARAYAELERAGVIETRRGLGTFVPASPARAGPDAVAERLAAIALGALAEVRSLGLSAADLVAEVNRQAGRG